MDSRSPRIRSPQRSSSSSIRPTKPSRHIRITLRASVTRRPSHFARGSRRRPASPTGYRPKQNGNTQSARARRRPSSPATRRPRRARKTRGAWSMGEGTPEWVADWYGPYPSGAANRSTGPLHGYFRVVRGGGLDFRKSKPGEMYPATAPYFMRSANRASMAPSYASKEGNIGFRVVQAPMPGTASLASCAITSS